MSKFVITGRVFEKILTKCGFSRAAFARFVSKNDKKQRTRQWASALILKYSSEEMPERWVNELRELIGKEEFEKQLAIMKQHSNQLGDNSRKKNTYSVKEFAVMVKAGTLPPLNRSLAQQNIRSVFNNKMMSDEEFIQKVKEMH